MSIDTARLAYLDTLELGHGSHAAPSNGMREACVMEAVAYIAGEPWSDHPACASPIITDFLIRWNDAMNDADRQMLKPLIPRIVGTRTNRKDETVRVWILTDWLARECAPAWLRLAGLTEHAEALEGLAPLVDAATAKKGQTKLDAAGAAAWDAAGAAAGAALAPTVKMLQASALLLVERMIEVGQSAAVLRETEQ